MLGQFAIQQVTIKTIRSHILYKAPTVNALSQAGPMIWALEPTSLPSVTERIDGRGIVQDMAANGVAWAFDLLECE